MSTCAGSARNCRSWLTHSSPSSSSATSSRTRRRRPSQMSRARATFQTRFFLAALSAAILALAVAGLLFATTMRRQIDHRIEDTLIAEARLAADLLSRGTPLATASELDDEADRIGQLIGGRVTFIAPDGRVVGDSAETLDAVRAMENHAQRPEVVAAREAGIGRER